MFAKQRLMDKGTLIPRLRHSDSFETENINWVLLVEKEVTKEAHMDVPMADLSRRHSALSLLLFFGTACLLMGCSSQLVCYMNMKNITYTEQAKGYPDVATRLLLCSLSPRANDETSKRPPIYALVDYDPDGIEILTTYKHGSAALSHDKAELAVPGLQWLGLRSEVFGQQDNLHQSQGLLRLTARDRRKARHMLTRDIFAEQCEDSAWRRELQVMLYLNVKAEIQLVEAQADGLLGWLKEHGLN